MARLSRDQRNSIRRAVQADMPALVDNSEAIRKRIAELNIAKLPPAIQRIAKDATLSPYLGTGTVYLNDVGAVSIFVAAGDYYGSRNPYYLEDAVIVELVATVKSQTEARAKADEALRRDLELCTTDAIFRERFPTLAKYLPESPRDIVRNLPATTATMDALKEAGWPTTPEE